MLRGGNAQTTDNRSFSLGRVSRRRVLKRVAAVAMSAAAAPLGACARRGGNRPQDEVVSRLGDAVTLTFWGTSTDVQGQAAQVLERFKAAYPAITVDFVAANSNNEKFVAALAGGTPPDVYHHDRAWVAEFAAKGYTARLSDQIKRARHIMPDDWWPKLRQDCTWKGAIHAIPRYTDGRALYWNKDLFLQSGLDPERPPATWDELEEVTRRIFKPREDGGIERVGFSPTIGNPSPTNQWLLALWQLGTDLLTPDGNRIAFDNELGVRALEWVAKPIEIHGGWSQLEAFVQTLPATGGQTPFSLGVVGAQLHIGQQITVLARVTPQLRYGVGPVPIPRGGRRATFQGGHVLAIPKHAQHPAVAFIFLDFTHAKENVLSWVAEQGGIPPMRSVATSAEYLAGEPLKKPFVDEMPYGRWVPVTPGLSDITAAINNWIPRALKKEIATRAAISSAARDVQEALDKWRPLREG